MPLHLVYFSPTGSTRAALREVAAGFASVLPDMPIHEVDCTLPQARARELRFTAQDLVIMGMPVYYGRIPALFHENGLDRWHGGGARTAYVVTYGDRAYEDALLELQLLAEKRAFVSVAAAALVVQHSLQAEMGKGRPHAEDVAVQRALGAGFARKAVAQTKEELPPLKLKGNVPHRDYGTSPFIPVTDTSLCTACGMCVAACPTQCIDEKSLATVAPDQCIACRACIKYCPVNARHLPPALAEVFAQRMQMLLKMCPGGNASELFGL